MYSVARMRLCKTADERIDCAFSGELNLIQSEAIRAFVVDVLRKLAPDYFWTHAASTTGKYHPNVSLGEGGLIRHTKLAVWWAVELYRMSPAEDRDEAIAALILHDLLKNGDSVDARGFPTMPDATKTHGIYLADKIMSTWGESVPAQPPAWVYRVVSAIRNHMGRWTKFDGPEKKFMDSLSSLDVVVHLCDYAASRKVDAVYRALEELSS